MANWQINVLGKGIRKATIEKLANKLAAELDEKVSITVSDNTPPESRADRFAWATGLIGDARSEAESLRDELQDWYDNLPEQFQNGDKGQQLEEAISQLNDFVSNCDDLEAQDVDFPGMY